MAQCPTCQSQIGCSCSLTTLPNGKRVCPNCQVKERIQMNKEIAEHQQILTQNSPKP